MNVRSEPLEVCHKDHAPFGLSFRFSSHGRNDSLGVYQAIAASGHEDDFAAMAIIQRAKQFVLRSISGKEQIDDGTGGADTFLAAQPNAALRAP